MCIQLTVHTSHGRLEAAKGLEPLDGELGRAASLKAVHGTENDATADAKALRDKAYLLEERMRKELEPRATHIAQEQSKLITDAKLPYSTTEDRMQ
jgi:hypothetical protein